MSDSIDDIISRHTQTLADNLAVACGAHFARVGMDYYKKRYANGPAGSYWVQLAECVQEERRGSLESWVKSWGDE